MYFVFPTAHFEQRARDLGEAELVDSIRKDVEAGQRASGLTQRFRSVPPYRVARRGPLRLIASLHVLGDHEVLVLLDLLKRDSRQYEEFCRCPGAQGWEHPSDDDISAWLSERTSSEIPRPRPLPDEMWSWLERPRWGKEFAGEDLVVYESENWVQGFRRKEINHYWQDYYNLLFELATDSANVTPSDFPGAELAVGNGVHVLFRRFELLTASRPRNVLFIIAAFYGGRPSAGSQADALARLKPLLELEHQSPLASVARYAARAYPDYLLGDRDAWFAIQEGEEANLALSPEEEEVLADLSAPKTSSTLPVFINGRAGSGKSTLLFYLFADYCDRKFVQRLPDAPLFLTYNERLVEVAREAVKNLLLFHHRFLANGSADESLPDLDGYFRPFQQFLLEFLPGAQREGFAPESHMSFYRFRRLYLGQALDRKVSHAPGMEQDPLDREHALNPQRAVKWSPELCWYVIRTFIKGYLPEGHMDPLDYAEVPRRERVVSATTFEAIYSSLWPWYRELSTAGYWDDQDLIRRVLEVSTQRDTDPPGYTAVFCDEAQDFTRLELRLIMQLSGLTRFDLGHAGPINLPFAFAGDPFQTLNPTGFRWEACKATFHEEVIEGTDPLGRHGLEMSFRELLFNYRSSPAIVQATNLIQLWRHVLFGHRELEPQEWWSHVQSPEPEWFVLGENLTRDEMKLHVTNTIILVPCEEGQEAEFARADAELSLVFSEELQSEAPKNVLSAITAKGLEFKRVILYKFGEACPASIWETDRDPNAEEFAAEYFFNKLYVAATRAREGLFIVDTPAGHTSLWSQAEPKAIESLVEHARDPDRWRPLVTAIAAGANSAVMTEDEPLTIAEEFREKGMSLGASEHLRRAGRFYASAGMPTDAEKCEAWALRFDDDYALAGQRFEELSLYGDAWSTYWEGLCWAGLDALAKAGHLPQGADTSEHGVARWLAHFMQASARDSAAITEFATFLDLCINTGVVEGPLRRQWKAVVRTFWERVEQLGATEVERGTWEHLALVLEELDRKGHRGPLRIAGSCYLRAEQHADAVRCWEATGATDQKEYFTSKARADGFPNGLRSLNRMPEQYGRDEHIIDAWSEAEGHRPARHELWSEIVAPAFKRRAQAEADPALPPRERSRGGNASNVETRAVDPERQANAVQFYTEPFDLFLVGDNEEYLESAEECLTAVTNMEKGEDVDRWDWIERLARRLMETGRWDRLLAFLDSRGVVFDDRSSPNRHAEKSRLGWDLIRGLAYVDRRLFTELLPPADLIGEIGQRRDGLAELATRLRRDRARLLSDPVPELKQRALFETLARRLLNQPWPREVTSFEVGSAYERAGSLVASLRFYERYADARDRGLREHARRRWVVVKEKQIRFFEGRSERAGQARTARSELDANVARWS